MILTYNGGAERCLYIKDYACQCLLLIVRLEYLLPLPFSVGNGIDEIHGLAITALPITMSMLPAIPIHHRIFRDHVHMEAVVEWMSLLPNLERF